MAAAILTTTSIICVTQNCGIRCTNPAGTKKRTTNYLSPLTSFWQMGILKPVFRLMSSLH